MLNHSLNATEQCMVCVVKARQKKRRVNAGESLEPGLFLVEVAVRIADITVWPRIVSTGLKVSEAEGAARRGHFDSGVDAFSGGSAFKFSLTRYSKLKFKKA